MGDEDLIIGDALPISSTSFDLSDPAFEDELQYIDDEDVGSEPAFELDAAEALFSDDDLAILEAFDPSATDTQANRLLVPMASETILGSSSIAYFHVPNQGADFAIPVRQDLLGYWLLDRIVLDHPYLDGGNADFLTKVGASVTLILFDGIGGIAELRTPSANADLNALELAIFGSLQRSSGVVLVGAIR